MTPSEFRRQADQPLRRLAALRTAGRMYLGIDLGTSELKLLLLDEQHRIVASVASR